VSNSKGELVLAQPSLPPSLQAIDAQRLIKRWTEGRSPNTVLAYKKDLEGFAKWRKASGTGAAINDLLVAGMGAANEILHSYRNSMVDSGLAPATLNRRLSALRSIVQLAREFGMIEWTAAVKGVKAQAYRDTAGPGVDGITKIKRGAESHKNPAKAARDVALVRVLFDLALRRSEIAALDLAHLDLRAGRLSITGKGRREREWVSLPARTINALQAHLKLRGRTPGPLFCNFHPANGSATMERLHANGIYWVLKKIGDQVDVRARPHGMRHSSITAGLDLANDPRAVQRHARHASLEVTMRYDDNRADLGGKVAKVVSEALEE
jgi:integrase/recombinase XerC